MNLKMEKNTNKNSPIRLEAYYYEFVSTGNREVDEMLSAIACAGKAFHHTSFWKDGSTCRYEDFLEGNTPVEWIQNRANKLAMEFEQLKIALEKSENTGDKND